MSRGARAVGVAASLVAILAVPVLGPAVGATIAAVASPPSKVARSNARRTR
jgi:hypothetical protein